MNNTHRLIDEVLGDDFGANFDYIESIHGNDR